MWQEGNQDRIKIRKRRSLKKMQKVQSQNLNKNE
jgi:hypothetical protein